uniref:Fucolectin tachylectin-4 pentraxin-1 domain-containing protein n=1 Tax=Callorhinchus milii TaxID=7868 RepID=A0A4W3GJL9_CALMI
VSHASIIFIKTVLRVSGIRENVAVGCTATQSSTFDMKSSADLAIDGNGNMDYEIGSCSKTLGGVNSWWRVNLMKKYYINYVHIHAVNDSKHDWKGIQIRVGNKLQQEGIHNPVCATLPCIQPGTSFTAFCKTPMLGQYVVIANSKCGYPLTLCEVEIFGTSFPENIALKGTATQSSIRDFLGDAGNAIDGNRDSDYYHGSCSKTNKDLTPWWRVDLHEKHWVFHVTITNKITYPERLNGAEIHVGNSLENNGNSNTICATVSFIPGGNSTIYHCGRGTQGRYINIVIPGYRGQLSLCEVEVHGVQV